MHWFLSVSIVFVMSRWVSFISDAPMDSVSTVNSITPTAIIRLFLSLIFFEGLPVEAACTKLTLPKGAICVQTVRVQYSSDSAVGLHFVKRRA